MRRQTILVWFLVHKWTSLCCTLFLLMLCVTGLPLIFHHEIDTALSPTAPLRALPTGTPLQPLDRLLGRLLADHPGEVPLYMSFDEDRPVVSATVAPRPDSPGGAMHFLSMDGRTGAALPPARSKIMDFILELHADMFLGLTGELFLGAMGILFAVAIVSGIVLYAPFMARLPFASVRRGRNRRLLLLDRHNLLGIVTVVWGLTVGVTGTINTLAIPLTRLWQAQELASIGRGGGAAPASHPGAVQRALDAAYAAVPGTRAQFIAFPGVAYSSPRHLTVYLQGTTPLTKRLFVPVFVDPGTGRIDAIGRVPWYMKALLLAEPLHFGDYGGLPLKLAWGLTDILTIAVLWTGLRLWLSRRSAPARVRVRVRELLSAGEGSMHPTDA